MSGNSKVARAARPDAQAGWTVPGRIDADEARKGTAAEHPMLVVTKDGLLPGAVVGPAEDRDPRGNHQVGRDARTAAEIEADIDRTRARLSDTLDTLTEQLSPGNLARRAGRGAQARFVDQETGQVRRGRLATATGTLAVGGLVVLARLRRGRKPRFGDQSQHDRRRS